MRLSLSSDNFLERAALMSGAVPQPVVLGAWGLFVSRVLLCSVKLGVWDALEAGPAGSNELAQKLALHPDGAERLLRVLNGMGYLRRHRGRYTLTTLAKKWLVSSSKHSMRDALLFVEELWNWVGHLEDAVRTGQARELHADGVMSPESWGRYLRGLAAFAKPAGSEIARRLTLHRPLRRLLDVGGGHGQYSVALCQKHPALEAVVLDLPQAVAHGRKLVDEAGMSDRITFIEGDMRQCDWGPGFDAVLLFNVLHNFKEDDSRAIVARAHAALRPGGTLAIQESEYQRTDGKLSFTSAFGELFFFLVSGARTWPEETLRGWMSAAGFEDVKTARLWLAPAVLVTGRRSLDG